jgi:hypothetical protein
MFARVKHTSLFFKSVTWSSMFLVVRGIQGWVSLRVQLEGSYLHRGECCDQQWVLAGVDNSAMTFSRIAYSRMTFAFSKMTDIQKNDI